MESALQDRNTGPRDLYESVFRFQEARSDMINDIRSFEVLHDSGEFSHLNKLLDQWLQLAGTVDTDIARYPVWRHVADLVEDLEPVNHRIWVDRIQPLLLLLQNHDYATPRGICIRESRFDHLPLLPFPPHWACENEADTNPALRTRGRSVTRRCPPYLDPGYHPQLVYPDYEPSTHSRHPRQHRCT